MKFSLLSLSLLLVAGSAQGAEPKAQEKCITQLQAEQVRIERDFARDRPPASDKTANERWVKNLHAALTAAGKAAESCERQSKPAMTSTHRSTLEACIAQVGSRSQEVERRYSGRTLSREEQERLRSEHQALHEQRIACDLASRRWVLAPFARPDSAA
jgi:hypothetical protein